jgi:hypothetical protein
MSQLWRSYDRCRNRIGRYRRDFGCRILDVNRHREPIALSDYGSNEPWSFGLIPQSDSKLSDCGIEARINVLKRALPYSGRDLISGDQVPCSFNQEHQQVERDFLQAD